MKIKFILPILLTAALFAGCKSNAAEEITETTVTTTAATTENQYYLVRGWEGHELLESIFYCGNNHSLPLSLEENPDFIFENGTLFFPDGSYAAASVNENGEVVALNLNNGSAPADFSVYGIGFNAQPSDIYSIVGIANSVIGDEENTISFHFYSGGITELRFVFEKRKLVEIYIAA